MIHLFKAQPAENDKITFWRIRSAIGLLGVALPILLLILPQISFFQTRVQPSISHYYYTNLRELFTGVLCAVGLFLIRYRGHTNPEFWKNDNLLTNIAGAMAFGVALFPTNPLALSRKNLYPHSLLCPCPGNPALCFCSRLLYCSCPYLAKGIYHRTKRRPPTYPLPCSMKMLFTAPVAD
jgi:hypothetical protein